MIADVTTRIHLLKSQAAEELLVKSIRGKGPGGSAIQARVHVLNSYLSVFKKCQTGTDFTLTLLDDVTSDGSKKYKVRDIEPFVWVLMSLDKLECNSDFIQLRRLADFEKSEVDLVKASKARGKKKDVRKVSDVSKKGSDGSSRKPDSSKSSKSDSSSQKPKNIPKPTPDRIQNVVQVYKDGNNLVPDKMASCFNVKLSSFKCFRCGGGHMQSDCTHPKDYQNDAGRAEVTKFREAKKEAQAKATPDQWTNAVKKHWNDGLYATQARGCHECRRARG
jgi:hypothetical protein